MRNIDKILEIIKYTNDDELLLRAKVVLQFIKLRKLKGYSQQDIADIMGVSKQLISRFERMENSPTLSFLSKYAKALNANINAIIACDEIKEESELVNSKILKLSEIMTKYTTALDILDDYDHQRLTKIKGNKSTYEMQYKEARDIINSMKFNSNSNLFGVEKEYGKLNGILEAIHQNIFGQELYPSVEDKAAHLLYFLVKDHPFADGCKRIAATLFLEFLNKNNLLFKNGKFIISNNTLVAITLLTAESKPNEMDMIINVIINLLNKKDGE